MVRDGDTMGAVVLTGHGGLDRLEFRRVPIPAPGAGEVLIKVAASSVNNTDINTRIGWYSKAVSADTASGGHAGFGAAEPDDAGWSGTALNFPRIQGADCAGRIVAVGACVPESRVGERVMVRTMLRAPVDFAPHTCHTFGSDCDGGFAEYAVAPSADTFAVDSPLSDLELGAVPCAYGTAEGMLQRAGVKRGDRVLVLGASGGVGSAAVQLAALKDARVIARCASLKAGAIKALGAETVIGRDEDLRSVLGRNSVDVIVDLVGMDFEAMPELLRRGGRYACAGAIAGPRAAFDLRSFYLKDLSFFGCAAQEDEVFQEILRLANRGAVRPLIADVFGLDAMAEAQTRFLEKAFAGKLAIEIR